LADLARDKADIAAGTQRIGDALMNHAVALETKKELMVTAQTHPDPLLINLLTTADVTDRRENEVPATAGKSFDVTDLLEENRQLRGLVIHLSKIILTRATRS
jgi:hypothetical protein